MGYNYGLLPWDVTAAIRGGAGPDVIARTIEGHAGDNGGVNRQRRMQEASIVLGAPVPAGGGSGATGGAPPAEGPYIPSPVPSFSPAAYQSSQPAPSPGFGTSGAPAGAGAGAPSISGASAPAGAPPGSPDSAAPTANRPIPAVMRAGGDQPPQTPWEKDRDTTSKAMIATMNDPTLDDETKDRRLGKLERRQRFAEYMVEQDSASRAKISNGVLDSALGKTLNGDAAGAYHDVDGAFRSGQIDARTYDAAQRVIQERSGSPNLAQYGPDYTKSLNDVLSKPGTPGRINNLTDLLQREAGGGLSPTGYAKLREAFNDAQSPEKQGVLEAKSATLNLVKQYMWYGEEGNFPGAQKDPKGQAAFDKFVVSFESKYDKWVQAGKDPFEFLSDQKSLMAIADTIRSPEQKRLDQIVESGGSELQKFTPDTSPLPPAPVGIGQEDWQKIVDRAPSCRRARVRSHGAKTCGRNSSRPSRRLSLQLSRTVLKTSRRMYPKVDIDGNFASMLSRRPATLRIRLRRADATPAKRRWRILLPATTWRFRRRCRRRGSRACATSSTAKSRLGRFIQKTMSHPDLAHDIEVTETKANAG